MIYDDKTSKNPAIRLPVLFNFKKFIVQTTWLHINSKMVLFNKQFLDAVKINILMAFSGISRGFQGFLELIKF